MATVIPIMGKGGFEENPLTVGAGLFQQWFLTDYSRTRMHVGFMRSITAALQRGGTEEEDILREVKESLGALFGRYFINVEITVDIERTKMVIKLAYLAEDTAYSLDRVLLYDESGANELLELNNDGDITGRIKRGGKYE